jgi:hypothetical protein
MVQNRSDRPGRDGGTRIAPDVRAEADRLRRLSDPKLTAPIYDDSSEDQLSDQRRTFFGRLRAALFS